MKLKIELEVGELNQCLDALARLPYHQVAPLIEKMTLQGRAQEAEQRAAAGEKAKG
jgi:hypothetical protein